MKKILIILFFFLLSLHAKALLSDELIKDLPSCSYKETKYNLLHLGYENKKNKKLKKCYTESPIFMSYAFTYPKNLQYASTTIKQDKEFIFKTLKEQPHLLSYLVSGEYPSYSYVKDYYFNNEDAFLNTFNNQTYQLNYFPKYNTNKNFIRKAIKLNPKVVKYINKDLKNDEPFMLELLNYSGYTLKYLNAKHKKDPEIVLKAVRQYPLAIRDADKSLKLDEKFISKVEALILSSKSEEVYLKNPTGFRNIGKSKDRKNILKLVKMFPNMFKYFHSKHYFKDEELMKIAVSGNPRLLIYMIQSTAEEWYTMYPSVAQIAVEKHPSLITWIIDSPHPLLTEQVVRGIVLDAIKKDGMALMYAGKYMKDKEVVITSIKQNSLAFYLADPSLQSDKGILQAYKKSRDR